MQEPRRLRFHELEEGGNIPAYMEDLPTYTIDQFPFLNFNVAIDVNTNSDAGKTLQLFSVFVDADGAAGGVASMRSTTSPALC